jgi:hypothetical protein
MLSEAAVFLQAAIAARPVVTNMERQAACLKGPAQVSEWRTGEGRSSRNPEDLLGGANPLMCAGEATISDLVALCLDHARPAK